MQIQITEELFYRSWNQVAMKVNEQQSDKLSCFTCASFHTRWNVLFEDDSDDDNRGGGL